MSANLSAVSVAQNGGNGKTGTCPKCGSKLAVRWSYVGGQGERLAVRCDMTNAPADGSGQRWCDFGGQLEGNERLFATA